jgi:hypothetical protein
MTQNSRPSHRFGVFDGQSRLLAIFYTEEAALAYIKILPGYPGYSDGQYSSKEEIDDLDDARELARKLYVDLRQVHGDLSAWDPKSYPELPNWIKDEFDKDGS